MGVWECGNQNNFLFIFLKIIFYISTSKKFKKNFKN
jgi:hypothetical protein